MRPVEEFSLFAILPDGSFEDLRLDETFDIRGRGAERFVHFHGDRSFRFFVDGRQIEWAKPTITGRILKALAGVDPATYDVYLDVRGDQPRQIANEEAVRHDAPGVERFDTVIRHTTEGSALLPERDRRYLDDNGYVYDVIQDNGSTGVVLRNFTLPPGKFLQAVADTLILLPLGYPDACPDMFFMFPTVTPRCYGRHARATHGTLNFAGRSWQQWSRHSGTGAWRGRHTHDARQGAQRPAGGGVMDAAFDVVLSRPHADHVVSLFDGSGAERAAYMLMGISRIGADPWSSKPRLRLPSHRFLEIEDEEIVSRSPTHVTWTTQGYMRLLVEAQRTGTIPAIVHTHPGGVAFFSDQDDRNERELARTARNRGLPGLVSVVLGQKGDMRARMWTSPQDWVDASRVLISAADRHSSSVDCRDAFARQASRQAGSPFRRQLQPAHWIPQRGRDRLRRNRQRCRHASRPAWGRQLFSLTVTGSRPRISNGCTGRATPTWSLGAIRRRSCAT